MIEHPNSYLCSLNQLLYTAQEIVIMVFGGKYSRGAITGLLYDIIKNSRDLLRSLT